MLILCTVCVAPTYVRRIGHPTGRPETRLKRFCHADTDTRCRQSRVFSQLPANPPVTFDKLGLQEPDRHHRSSPATALSGMDVHRPATLISSQFVSFAPADTYSRFLRISSSGTRQFNQTDDRARPIAADLSKCRYRRHSN